MARPVSELLARLGLPEVPEAEPRFVQALTHSSAVTGPNYERLEFLGDAVLKLAVSGILYERLPEASEGVLTKIRARVVADATLAKVAHAIELGAFLHMGAAERRSGGASKVGTLAAAYEALLAAVYQTHGWNTLLHLVATHLATELEAAILEPGAENYKALLQEATQERFGVLPSYRVVGGEGPQHQHIFIVEVEVLDRVLGSGRGVSKKAAEQQAASLALSRLDEIPSSNDPRRNTP